MLALAGFGTPHLRGRMTVEDEVVLFYAGLFAARLRPPGALRSMLADYLGMNVRIEPFSGRWVPVARASRPDCRAGRAAAFTRLGVDTVAGGRCWDVQGNFRVVVGPVDRAGMRALMPDQPALRKLVDLVRAYAGLDLGFDVQVILHADSVPELEMAGPDGRRPAAAGLEHLGQAACRHWPIVTTSCSTPISSWRSRRRRPACKDHSSLMHNLLALSVLEPT